MKVYVLIVDDVYEYERFKHDARVFADAETALAALDKEYKDVSEMLKDNGNDWVSDVYKKGFASFSMYPDGYWGTSHYDAWIDEVEVEE
jgi:hypothetical protein